MNYKAWDIATRQIENQWSVTLTAQLQLPPVVGCHEGAWRISESFGVPKLFLIKQSGLVMIPCGLFFFF